MWWNYHLSESFLKEKSWSVFFNPERSTVCRFRPVFVRKNKSWNHRGGCATGLGVQTLASDAERERGFISFQKVCGETSQRAEESSSPRRGESALRRRADWPKGRHLGNKVEGLKCASSALTGVFPARHTFCLCFTSKWNSKNKQNRQFLSDHQSFFNRRS